MSIDGLKNIPGIIPIKQERDAGQNSQRNQKKDRNKDQKNESEEKREKKGKVDIRI